MADERAAKWIVGLGNPGRKYRRTRHNVGFWVVERFAAREGFEGERKKFKAVYFDRPLEIGGERVRVFLVKPQTYVNLSGPAVRDLLGFFGTRRDADLRDRLIVVHDDLDLPVGRVRFRAGGSAGGHRGVASIIQALGHDRFGRLKIGVGRPGAHEAADYVLEKLDEDTQDLLSRVAEESAKMLSVWLECGMQSCMNRFNAEPVVPEGTGGDRT